VRARGPRPDERAHEAELRARGELDVERDRALHADHEAQQLVRHRPAEVVLAVAGRERQRVEQAHPAAIGREGRLGDERPGHVAPADRRRLGRPDRPVPGVGPEEPREHRGAVEARQAQPVDRAVARDERRPVAVGEQRVVGDRQRGGPRPRRERAGADGRVGGRHGSGHDASSAGRPARYGPGAA
jgi:hypothetical protein